MLARGVRWGARWLGAGSGCGLVLGVVGGRGVCELRAVGGGAVWCLGVVRRGARWLAEGLGWRGVGWLGLGGWRGRLPALSFQRELSWLPRSVRGRAPWLASGAGGEAWVGSGQ